jgi:hypothetical protein
MFQGIHQDVRPKEVQKLRHLQSPCPFPGDNTLCPLLLLAILAFELGTAFFGLSEVERVVSKMLVSMVW